MSGSSTSCALWKLRLALSCRTATTLRCRARMRGLSPSRYAGQLLEQLLRLRRSLRPLDREMSEVLLLQRGAAMLGHGARADPDPWAALPEPAFFELEALAKEADLCRARYAGQLLEGLLAALQQLGGEARSLDQGLRLRATPSQRRTALRALQHGLCRSPRKTGAHWRGVNRRRSRSA